MTRSERVRAACERFAEGRPDEKAETVDQGIEAALDAALADLGGLDGLDEAPGRFGEVGVSRTLWEAPIAVAPGGNTADRADRDVRGQRWPR